MNLEDVGSRDPGGDIEAARPGFGQAGVYPFPVQVEGFHAFYPLRRAFHMEIVLGGIRVNAEAFRHGVGMIGQIFYLYFVRRSRFSAGIADGGMVKPVPGRDKLVSGLSFQGGTIFVPLIGCFLIGYQHGLPLDGFLQDDGRCGQRQDFKAEAVDAVAAVTAFVYLLVFSGLTVGSSSEIEGSTLANQRIQVEKVIRFDLQVQENDAVCPPSR